MDIGTSTSDAKMKMKINCRFKHVQVPKFSSSPDPNSPVIMRNANAMNRIAKDT